MALIDPIIQFQKERASVPFQPPTLCTCLLYTSPSPRD